MPELLKMAEYARRRGVSRSAVSKAVRAGRISLIDGRIDPAVADIQWQRNTDPQQALRATRGRMPRAVAPPLPGPASGAAPDDGFGDARARREQALAELAELELAERRRELVRVEHVRHALAGKIMGVRDALDTLADRLAPLLAAEADSAKVYALLREEVRRALAGLAADAELRVDLPR
jgi:hypothetical protein